MKETIIVIVGTILFVEFFLPIISTSCNWVCAKISSSIQREQMKLDLDARENEAAAETILPSPSMTQAIGFQVPSEEEYYEDED